MAIQSGLKAGLNSAYTTIAGEGRHRASLIAQTRERHQGHVTLTGALAELGVYQLLSKADAFVLPSSGIGEAWHRFPSWKQWVPACQLLRVEWALRLKWSRLASLCLRVMLKSIG